LLFLPGRQAVFRKFRNISLAQSFSWLNTRSLYGCGMCESIKLFLPNREAKYLSLDGQISASAALVTRPEGGLSRHQLSVRGEAVHNRAWRFKLIKIVRIFRRFRAEREPSHEAEAARAQPGRLH
jgi:hypothetical protein